MIEVHSYDINRYNFKIPIQPWVDWNKTDWHDGKLVVVYNKVGFLRFKLREYVKFKYTATIPGAFTKTGLLPSTDLMYDQYVTVRTFIRLK